MNRSPDVEKTSIPKPHGNTGRPSRHPTCHNLWSCSSSSTRSWLNLRLTMFCPNDRRYEGLYRAPRGAAALSADGDLLLYPRKMQMSMPTKMTMRFKRDTTLRIFHQIPRSIINVSWSYVSTGTSRRCMIQTSMTMIKCRLAFCHLLMSNLSMSALYGGESHRHIVLHAFWTSSSTCTNATRCPWTACQKHLEE
jgi:hypothetical protein